MKEAPRQTLIRHSDEAKLEVGAVVPVKDGVIGVVLARFIRCGKKETNDFHYIVEVRSDRSAKVTLE